MIRVRTVSALSWMVLVVAGTAACDIGQAEESAPWAAIEVVRGGLEITADANGRLEPIRKVDVMSKASGEVVEVLVDTGDPVEAGQLIARVDPRDVQNAFSQSEADLQVARERYEIAEAQLRRSQELLAAGIITDQEFESRNLDYVNARATLIRSEQSHELARVRMEDVTVRSPLTGLVLAAPVEAGQVISSPGGSVSGGTVLVTVGEIHVMELQALINETDIGRIHPGMPVTVTVDAFPDRPFRGHVEKIEAQATIAQNVVNFPIVVRLQNEDGVLRPGMTASVSVLIARRPDALMLPNHAIVEVRELEAAGQVLGLSTEQLELDPSAFDELRAQLIEERGRDEVAAAPAAGPPAEASADRRAAGGERAGIRRGDGPMMARGPAGGRMGPSDAAPAASLVTPIDRARPRVVFVEQPDGSLRARPILIGITDWTEAEILAGVEEGERVALLGGSGGGQQGPGSFGPGPGIRMMR